MYAPLKFVEQMEGYFKLANARNMEEEVNLRASQFVEDYMTDNRDKVYHDYGAMRKVKNINLSDKTVKDYNKVYHQFCNTAKIAGCMDSINDFFDLLLFYDVRNIWRKNKLVYLLDNDLFDTLLNMEVPKLAPVDCLTKLPASCFYLDYNGKGGELCKDLVGTFIVTSKTDMEINIILMHLIDSSVINRVIPLTTMFRLDLSGTEKFVPAVNEAFEAVKITSEDGITRCIDDRKVLKLVYNFLIYLNASNRDVKISERTRKNHEAVQTVIKNKFCEVKEFEVGFTYGRTIRQNDTKVRYVGDKKTNGVAHGTKSSHYRSAHWHHYWTGSGDDKKLIIKWVEGVFVNGGRDEAENVQVHKVK